MSEYLSKLPRIRSDVEAFANQGLALGEQARQVLPQESIKAVNEACKHFHYVKDRVSSLYHPQIMLYGVYNAGKSTLLNALAGEDLAPVGDIPTTKEVTRFTWEGYIFYDTPGIDSPNRKEGKKARSLIPKVEVVIFVLRDSGTIEERKVYEEMDYILSQNKELLIVLNVANFTLDEDQEELIKMKHKILLNLRKKRGMAENEPLPCHFLFVDAQMALKGKKEGKEQLVEASGIYALENFVLNILKSERVFQKNFDTVFQALFKGCEDLERILNQQNPEKELEELKQIIFQIKKETQEEILQFMKMHLDTLWKNPLLISLRNKIWQCIDDNRTCSNEDIQKEITRITKDFMLTTHQKLKSYLRQRVLPELEEELGQALQKCDTKKTKHLGKALEEKLKDIEEGLATLGKVDFSKIDSDRANLEKALKAGEILLESEALHRALKKLKDKFDQKTLEKILGDMSKMVGKVVAVKGGEAALKIIGKEGLKKAVGKKLGTLMAQKVAIPIPTILDIVLILDLLKDLVKIFRVFLRSTDEEVERLNKIEQQKQVYKEMVLEELQTNLEKVKLEIYLIIEEYTLNLLDQIFKEWFAFMEKDQKEAKLQEVLQGVHQLKDRIKNYYLKLA